MTVEQGVVAAIAVYIAFGTWVCRVFWRWTSGYSKGFPRNALRSSAIAAVWAPSFIGSEGGPAPAPALIALFFNVARPGDWLWAIPVSAIPMSAVWTATFITLTVLDRRAPVASVRSAQTGIESNPGPKSILFLLIAGLAINAGLGAVTGQIAQIFHIGLKNQWQLGVLSCVPVFLTAALLARLWRYDWKLVGALIWLPGAAAVLSVTFAWAVLGIVPPGVSAGLLTIPSLMFSLIITFIAASTGALVGQRGRERAHSAGIN